MDLEANSKTLQSTTGPGREGVSSAGSLSLDELEVNNLELFEPILITYFEEKVKSFKGGQLADVHAKGRHTT